MGWMTHANGDAFALIRLRAPEQVAVSDNYSQDVYFLIDRSGSMEGLKWQKAVQAFREFVRGLGKDDRVWATFFESNVRDLAEAPVPAHEVLADRAVQNLEALGTTGGTELLPALNHVLSKIAIHSTARPMSLVLITDGQVGNEAQILKSLSGHAQLRVHVFGIDVAINDGFLQKLAAQHHGTSCLMSPQDDIVGAVARLGNRLRKPVWTSIRVQDGWEIVGQTLPDLYEGQVLSLPLKSNGAARSVTLDGKLPDGTSKSCRFDLVQTSAVALPLLWAKRRIEFHLAKGETQEAIALAKANNIVCEGAAFIAWDETEKVPVSAKEVYQPTMEPAMARGMRFIEAKRSVKFAAGPADARGGATYRDVAPAPRARMSEGGESLMDRVRRVFTHTADLREASNWRTDLEKDSPFQTVVARQLLDLLEDWLRSQPRDWQQNLQKLMLLCKRIRESVAHPQFDRLQIVRQWITQTLRDQTQVQALEKLRQIEEELQPKATNT
jgi:hypothetical protein